MLSWYKKNVLYASCLFCQHHYDETGRKKGKILLLFVSRVAFSVQVQHGGCDPRSFVCSFCYKYLREKNTSNTFLTIESYVTHMKIK